MRPGWECCLLYNASQHCRRIRARSSYLWGNYDFLPVIWEFYWQASAKRFLAWFEEVRKSNDSHCFPCQGWRSCRVAIRSRTIIADAILKERNGSSLDRPLRWIHLTDYKWEEEQAIKNPPTLNRMGGVDGLHKLGKSKKSSGINYDWQSGKKFAR